jgi:D-beta-D-heptose 7-phosphate kinase/D-beta-D-heptose 1-phosphate adenosyltransferase
MIQPLKKSKILLLGDSCIDQYVHITLNRTNPEANAPLGTIRQIDNKHGMAANVLEGLLKLGFQVTPRVYGNSIKTRYLDAGNQILRVDNDVLAQPVNLVNIDFSKFDAVVISDYNKGYIQEDTILEVLRRTQVPIFLDTKKRNLRDFEGCIIKINQQEFDKAYSLPSKNLVVTHGERGSSSGQAVIYSRKVDVVDTCGAGDAYLVGLVYGLLSEGTWGEAMRLASSCAEISIMNLGCYMPLLKELNEYQTKWFS